MKDVCTRKAMRGSVEHQTRTLLRQKDYDRLLELCEEDKRFWKAVRYNLYETDANLIWPAIETVARMMERWWNAGDMERVRDFIRGLIWSLSDESGGIGWNAPQTIAEIIVHIPELLEPYGSIMIDRSMAEPSLVNSGLWGIGRLGKRMKAAVALLHNEVLRVFQVSDPETLGLASKAMGEVGFEPALVYINTLIGREDLVTIFVDGRLETKPLGQWATEAIGRIQKRPE